MGTEVLRPQDVLSDRFHGPPAALHRRRHFPGAGNLTTIIAAARKPNTNNNNRKPDKKKPNHGDARRRDDAAAAASMGQVTLLRRGESLDSLNKNQKPKSNKPADDLAVLGAGRIGPETVPKRIFSSPPSKMYAGSAFSNSPSPQSLPVPSFFSNKKQQSFDDSATRDLRRLLRLE